ncbi:hypothetical protein CANARDRAFT_27010 [[Candida] arabinofermentans NRRL YB-2248]|uniref:Glutamate decarboxylase n=1 Tax=[Candida] arabinofermentans NRRL YB-2248 TaxID=983967 RepID=A0A1E4T484_9ASCO|nr:hypothetical protein CANARDRAFT_27010 [[Candida] arabinofermentans NRRL YB-2248]
MPVQVLFNSCRQSKSTYNTVSQNLKVLNWLQNLIPKNGMDSRQVYELLHDGLTLDGNTTLNLASFVNVHVEDDAEKLIIENLTKNLADNDEYPMLIELQQRCISILADLWHAPSEVVHTIKTKDGEQKVKRKTQALGTACTGSSEAIMLGGLAMKKNWQAKRKAKGLNHYTPNILMASCCQVALEKFARYFDVEARIIKCSEKDFLIDCEQIKENLDENTIGVFVILGSTYTGGFENVTKVNEILDDYEKETGNFIPIHIDGASGGVIAPIIYPELVWDFRLDRVVSINCSGHKFGLTTAGLGWVIFRSEDWLPEELKFQLQYLGGLEESFTLNFSRPGYQVVHQYYNFLHLGERGYFDIYDNCLTNARILSKFLEQTGFFTCISNLHLPVGQTTRGGTLPSKSVFQGLKPEPKLNDHTAFNPALPVVSFQFTKQFSEEYPEIPQIMVSNLLRNRKWIVPNYGLPKTSSSNTDDTNNEILRVVVKYNLTSQLLDKLMHDIVEVVEVLTKSTDMVREKVKNIRKAAINAQSADDEENVAMANDMIYNMLLSIANEGNEKLIKMRDHSDHKHDSFRAIC